MKVFVKPTGMYSRAMVRIADALARHAPPSVSITADRDAADLVVLYVIGPDALQAGRDLVAAGKKYAAVQCCWKTTGVADADWMPFWRDADLVWSYYQLPGDGTFNFYYAPLGVDTIFASAYRLSNVKQPTIITTGFVSSPAGEAIEEVWLAARRCNFRTIHIGPPNVEGTLLHADEHIQPSDAKLAAVYAEARWVASLRHTEGFECPAAEAVVAGTRPLLFDQPTLLYWYRDVAEYVPECSGDVLVDLLTIKLSGLDPVSGHERDWLLRRFDWATICRGFWERVL